MVPLFIKLNNRKKGTLIIRQDLPSIIGAFIVFGVLEVAKARSRSPAVRETASDLTRSHRVWRFRALVV